MAPSVPAVEEAQSLPNEKSSLLAVEGEMELRTESIGEKLLRGTLDVLIWLTIIFYIATLVVYPTKLGTYIIAEVRSTSVKTCFGVAGGLQSIWSAPIFVLVFLGIVHLHFFPRSSRRNMKKKAPKASLGSHPIFVSGPFGVVSAAEVLCIVAFTVVMTWMFVMLMLHSSHKSTHANTNSWKHYFKSGGFRLGIVAQFCLGLLFLPVARGSVLLRLVDIPFEHAAKYHVWLGHFTMTLFTLHGLGFAIPWAADGDAIYKLTEWRVFEIANLAGVISLAAGLCMWMTSFQITRKSMFELFFYTHQLYTIFIVFMVFHVGDFLFGIPFAGIFLFIFDRFLRFCQSRKDVGILSTRVLPCGTFELVLPKPKEVQYNALSFVFLQVPALGGLQWHPFSVSSSPEDSPDNIKFLVKPLGSWTAQLNEKIKNAATAKCPLRLTAAVEGPYGHESSYFLNYEALLLVAGGIGVSPFVAIIRDLLHRHQMKEAPLPGDVTLIWAVKNRKELAILDSLCPVAIFPDYSSRLRLTVKAFVTQEGEGEADLEDGAQEYISEPFIENSATEYDPAAAQRPISHLVGSGSILWVGAALAASLIGYLLMTGLFGKFYLLPVDHNSYTIVPWWRRVVIQWVSILFGIWVAGGGVILLWNVIGSRSTSKQSPATEPLLSNSQEYRADDSPAEKLVRRSNTVFGARPDMEEIFEGCAKRLSGTNVGVLVCGPEGLQSSVANQCRGYNTVNYCRNQVAFSYHSVSFEL